MKISLFNILQIPELFEFMLQKKSITFSIFFNSWSQTRLNSSG